MIYIVEDDEGIRELVMYTLKSSGLETMGFPSAKEFWKAMAEKTPKAVLLDIMLPDEDGLMILKKLRLQTSTKKLPVMMLTAKGSELDKVTGLDMGADDYLPKPFGIMEMTARVKSLLRRAELNSGLKEIAAGDIKVDIPKHIVTACAEEVILTIKEFDLLVFLLRNIGIVLTRDKILAEVWGYDFDGETRTVDVHVRTLRSKLGKAGDLIQTVRGLGYKAGEL